MNGLLFKRSWCLAIIMLILPFSNVSFAETNTKNYDTKQLIRDVAVLYRKHKLAEMQQPRSMAATPKVAKKDTRLKIKAKRKSSKLARSIKRKARARKLLKSKKRARNSRVAKAKKRHTGAFKRHMTVTATAYTSHVNQTDSTPNIAAWGDRLKPGMKVIAVSRDMLNKYGLKHRSKVRIKGLDGEYLVLDKMNKRWKKKIDIYMGKDLKKAFKWGKKKVELQWN